MKGRLALWSLVLAFAISPARAAASTIVELNVGTAPNGDVFIGQSLTTTTGGPWDNISFNLFEPDDDPYALGTLFILDTEYLGTPANLTSLTPGYLADTSSISAGTWVFGAGLTLQPLTTYYFYATSSIPANAVTSINVDPYDGGVGYISPGGGAYLRISEIDTDFRLAGSVVEATVPEPASLTLLGLGLAGMGARRWRQRKAS